MPKLTIQIHHTGKWHDAALIEIQDERAGIGTPSSIDYDMNYVIDWDTNGLAAGTPARDRRAISVVYPTDFTPFRCQTWPPFLLDMLPQGPARERLAKRLGFENPGKPEVEYPLLLLGGGGPIGNLRIKEAWQQEQQRLKREACAGLTRQDILDRSDRFREVVDKYVLLASGSSGVQGEWPKVLLTQASDGLWYPDPLVEDEAARKHVIVKLLRDANERYTEILAAEAPYLEVARAFGLRVAQPLEHADGVLVIPRFDREVIGAGIVRHGQESLVSAIGVAQMGYVGAHEDYLAIVKEVSTDPAEEIAEYVFRDILNVAMGNPDNHGRNTALRKDASGWMGLTPLFDFAPMRLDPQVIVRSTSWRCLKGRDAAPDWGVICEAAAEGVIDAGALRAKVTAKANFLHALPEIARQHGVADRVIEVACARHEEVALAVKQAAVGGAG